MDSRTVNRELRAAIRPVLQVHGFVAFTERTAWRYRPGRIDVANFQSFNDYLAGGIGCTTYSFALNLGSYLTCVPDDDQPIKHRRGQLAPQEFECHLRCHPHRTISQSELGRTDIWYVDPAGGYLSDVIRDARKVLLEVGLPWFDEVSDDAALLADLKTRDRSSPGSTVFPGGIGSPVRDRVVGYLSWALGDTAGALAHLNRALMRRRASAATLVSPRSKWRPPPMAKLESDVQRLRELHPDAAQDQV